MSIEFLTGFLPFVIGVLLLFAGRRLFWLLIAGAGFAFGYQFAHRVLPQATGWEEVGLALFLGLLGALMAYFLKRAAVFGAGFLGGGYLVLAWLRFVYAGSSPWVWAAFAAGGLAGGFFAATVFDWALMILSSLLGATIITEGLALSGLAEPLFLVVAASTGLAVQLALLAPREEEPGRRKTRR